MALKKYDSCPIPRPKHMPKSNSGDAKLRDISLFAKHPSHQSKKLKKLDTVFNIQSIGCYNFQGLHPICFSFSRVGAISLIN